MEQENRITDDKRGKSIGLVVISTLNYGNQLVNLALYQLLIKLGYNVSLIYPPTCVNENYRIEKNIFIKSPYREDDIIKVRDFSSLIKVNEIFDFFIVGGDQQFRYTFIAGVEEFSCLDWVHWSKRKISIGTSFGINYYENMMPYILNRFGYWFQRFQSISVREQSGVDLLRECFGVENSKKIMDPVFLCGAEYIKQLAQEVAKEYIKESYIGAYLLDLTNEKKNLLQKLSDKYCKGKHLVIKDAVDMLKAGDRSCEQEMHVLQNAKVEEWLAMIDGCQFFVTDSFHGVCIALLLKKPFCVIFEQTNWRGFTRIKEILSEYHLEERVVSSYEEYLKKGLDKKQIDFERIHRQLEEKREDSIQWIRNALEKETVSQEESFYQGYINKAFKFNPITENIEPVYIAWGAGNRFLESEGIIRSKNIQYVCDQNPDKWGREIISGIKCIHFEKLKEFKNVIIIITIDSWEAEQEIVEKIQYLDNILGYIHLRMLFS